MTRIIVRGLGAHPKFIALKDLFLSVFPNLILIQETMHMRSEVVSYFQKMFPSWHITTTDSTGLSGGLVALWDPTWVSVKALRCFAGILLEGKFRGTPGYIHILNVYAPYKDRFTFWNQILSSDIMELASLMIAGDLNCTFNICPAKITPTWDNGRSGSAYLAQRLDHFLVHEKLIERLGLLDSEILSNFTSDHRPITLQWRNAGIRKGFPFKFNRNWLEDPAFNDLVQESWNNYSHQTNSSPSQHLLDKLAFLRKIVKSSQKQKLKANRKYLEYIQTELDRFALRMTSNCLPLEVRLRINDLENRKKKSLDIEEAAWRLKSRAIWLSEGDRNTMFFHRYANHRRNINTICEIKVKGGKCYHS
eukprot:PITA_19600